MPLLAKARSFFRNLFFFDRRDSDLDQEIRSHLEMLIAENIRAGMPPGEAQRAARIELGGSEQVKEQVREVRMGNWLHSVASDCRFGLRQLRKNPGFTAVAVVTLAVAIGANAVVFGVLNALILHPLNMPDAESLYGIQHENEASSYQSYSDYLDLRDRNHSFNGLAAYNAAQAGLDTGENPSRVWLYEVSGNYFDVLGIHPYLGRVFHDSDEHGDNSAPYIVLSYAYWHTRFQDDRGVLGHTVQINKHPFTIVGVAPPEFHGTLVFFNPDFFVPIVNQEQVDGENLLSTRGRRWVFMAMGHLKTGVTPAQAIADLNSIGSYLEKTYPKDDDQRSFTLARPGLYGDYLGKPIRAFMTGLMLLAGLILLAACANLGSLFAARAADRSREVALRLALGASRTRVLRQLFTEAVLLSLLGGAVGLSGSVVLLRTLSAWQPFSKWPAHVPVNPDANVYAVALLLTLASGILFGAVPIRQVLHTDPYEIVKSGSLRRVGRRITVRDLLLGAQIAICAVLVTSSMVAVRGLQRSLHSNFGFEPRNVMLVDTQLSMADYRGDAVPRIQKRIIDAVEKIAGVESVGLIDAAPLVAGGYNGSLAFTDDKTDLRSSNAAADAFKFSISPEYFHAASTALLSGRTLTWHDDESSPRVAVINQEFARKMFGSVTNAVGGYYKMPDGTRVQVVGMVQDGKYRSLTEDPQPAMFLPILQSPSSQTYLAVRSDRNPEQLVAAIRSAVRDLDASLPLYIEPWNKVYSSSRLVTLCLSPIVFPTSDEFQWGEVGEGLVRAHAVVGMFPMAQLVVEPWRLIGVRVHLIELFVVSAMGALDMSILVWATLAGARTGVIVFADKRARTRRRTRCRRRPVRLSPGRESAAAECRGNAPQRAKWRGDGPRQHPSGR
jgi:predicted permease